MKAIKVCAALMLAGLATGASADRLQAEQDRIQVAQAGGGQGEPGKGPGGPGGGESRRGPPPEAIAACKDKASGAACSFTGRQNEKLTGTCFAPPAGGPGPSGNQAGGNSAPGKSGAPGDRPLACRPDRNR